MLSFPLPTQILCKSALSTDIIRLMGIKFNMLINFNFLKFLYICCCTAHFDVYKVHKPTNALFIKLDKVLKFTLKITSTS